MSESIDILFERRIEKFYEFVKTFLIARSIEVKNVFIEDFKNFLNYKETPSAYIFTSYTSLYRAPKELLVSSKEFKSYWNKLDKDFRDDILDEETYKRQYLTLTTQQSLQQIIKKYLDKDCVW